MQGLGSFDIDFSSFDSSSKKQTFLDTHLITHQVSQTHIHFIKMGADHPAFTLAGLRKYKNRHSSFAWLHAGN